MTSWAPARSSASSVTHDLGAHAGLDLVDIGLVELGAHDAPAVRQDAEKLRRGGRRDDVADVRRTMHDAAGDRRGQRQRVELGARRISLRARDLDRGLGRADLGLQHGERGRGFVGRLSCRGAGARRFADALGCVLRSGQLRLQHRDARLGFGASRFGDFDRRARLSGIELGEHGTRFHVIAVLDRDLDDAPVARRGHAHEPAFDVDLAACHRVRSYLRA